MKSPVLIVKNIMFVSDRLELGSPAQQLLDRFLIGYSRDGVFREGIKGRVSVISNSNDDLIQKRAKDFGLLIGKNVSDADAIIVADSSATLETVKQARRRTRVFVYGIVSREVVQTAMEREVPLFSGTTTATALRLPAMKSNLRAQEALVIVQGAAPIAELAALDGLMPLVSSPRPVKRARYLEGEAIWAAGEKREWAWSLLRAAISRSDSPQGNALLDGRVEDMAGLGHVQTLAKNPRGWLLEHEDGFRSTILVLDGVVTDTLVALNVGGRIHSTQLFRAPSPMRADYDRLVAVIDDFFATGKAPWGLDRSRMIGAAIEHISKPDSRKGEWVNLA